MYGEDIDLSYRIKELGYSADTPRVQEVHGLVVHLLCELVEQECAP